MPTTVNLSGPSAGYAGTVDAAQWADLIPDAGGSIYGVNGMNDWRPTLGGTGDRAVTIAAGSGWGHGVRDVSAAPITLNHDSATGERWDLIVARRTWATKVTCFTIIQGSATKALPERNSSPGTLDDQPVALVRIVGNTAVEVINLLVYPGDGGAFAVDRLVLTYLDRLGTQVRIGDTLWFATFNVLGQGVWEKLDLKPFAVARGTFNALTSPTGTATIDHGLGVVPAVVVATDQNVPGGAPATRKVTVSARNASQIQFTVFNNGFVLTTNPVTFDWVAFA